MQQYNFARYTHIYIYMYIFTTNNHMQVCDEEILLILQFRLPHVLGCIFKR